jgi:methyltransferase (TIGR00027 family)
MTMGADMDHNTALETTARWTAAVRALETAEQEPLFEDPWAAELAGPEGEAWIEARTPESVLPIVLRTRFFDDWLHGLMAEAAIAQVVLLGAGLDTRSFRLAWPAGTRVYELDREAVLVHKERVLARAGVRARCARRVVVADLADDWPAALAGAGFEAGRPATWLLEGLLFYLPWEQLVRVLEQVTAHAAVGSRLGFDIVNAAVLTSPYTRSWVEMQAAAGAPWLGTMEDPLGFLARRGWDATLTQAGQADANHGRWTLPVVPTTLPDFPHSWFVTASRST